MATGPLLAWVYGIGFANFCQSLSPEQKPQNPTGGGNGPPPPTHDQNGIEMVMRAPRKASATWKWSCVARAWLPLYKNSHFLAGNGLRGAAAGVWPADSRLGNELCSAISQLHPGLRRFSKIAAEPGDRGKSVRGKSVSGMANIPLTLIPLTRRSWQTSGCSGWSVQRSPLVAAPPRYGLAFRV